jgi:hypothetical protein
VQIRGSPNTFFPKNRTKMFRKWEFSQKQNKSVPKMGIFPKIGTKVFPFLGIHSQSQNTFVPFLGITKFYYAISAYISSIYTQLFSFNVIHFWTLSIQSRSPIFSTMTTSIEEPPATLGGRGIGAPIRALVPFPLGFCRTKHT